MRTNKPTSKHVSLQSNERQPSMVRIVTDSTSSLPADIKADLGIETISLIINRLNLSYIESETDLDVFYQDIYEMADDIPTSSQPSQKDIKDSLQNICSEGEEALGIFLSSKMSGTFETFLHVAHEVAEENPGFRFAAIDSMTNCMEMGHAIISAAKAAKSGLSLEECSSAANESLHSSRFLFTPESLRFLEKGGRIGKAAALIGNAIKIVPVLTVKDGEAASFAKARSQKKAMEKIVKTFADDISRYGLKEVTVHYIGSKAPAERWANEVVNPLIGFRARILPASPVIGVHVGPAVGIAYECNSRINNKYTLTTPEVII